MTDTENKPNHTQALESLQAHWDQRLDRLQTDGAGARLRSVMQTPANLNGNVLAGINPPASTLTKQDIQTILREGTLVHVLFTKVDGTQRSLTCTIDPTMIPEDKLPTIPYTEQEAADLAVPIETVTEANDAVKILSSDLVLQSATKSPDIARVFDVTIQEWRSFRYDSVLAINTIED